MFHLTSFDILKYDCVIKTREMFSFLPLINNSVTIELRFDILRFFGGGGCILKCFYKYYPYYSSVQ